MKYRLGIDLGTASIGVAGYSLDENNEIQDLIYLDSYIFGEPVDPKALVTTNTNRRSARLIRRQIERKAKRLKKIGYIAHSIGVQKSDLDKISGDKIHELRAKAISHKIELPELIKVFCHIVKNRGYKGDLKRAEGTVASKIKETGKMLEGKQTLGELLYDKKLQMQANNDPWRKLNQDGAFVERDFIEKEFKLIYEKQKDFHKELQGNYKVGYESMFLDHVGEKEISIYDAFKSAMFYQRPIKWKLDSVGYCSLEQDEFRSAVSQIAYQNYRLAGSISNLRIRNTQDKIERPLTQDEIKKVYDFVSINYAKYNSRNKISYNLIYTELNLKDYERFTIDRTKDSAQKEAGLKGNTTLKCFYDLDAENFIFINTFNGLSSKSKELVLEFLANITKYADIQDNPDSYIESEFLRLTQNVVNSPSLDNEWTAKPDGVIAVNKAIEFIKLLKTKEAFYDKFDLEQGRGSYSVKALEKLTAKLLKGKNEQDIIEELYPPKSVETTSVLREFEKVQTNNPVIDKCLREFKRTMDFVVKKFGANPTEITIELTRELKNSLAKRSYIEKQNNIARQERAKAIEELQENRIILTSENIEKYLLLQEQDGLCPYCGQFISIGNIINKTQIDHIVPQSIGGPNIFSNKILAHTQCNHDKGEKIPYEFKFKDDIDNYIDFLKMLSAKKKTKKSDADAMQKEERIDFGNHSSLINLVKSLWQKYNKEKQGYFDKRKKQWTATQKGKRLRGKIDFLLATTDDYKDLIGDFSNLHLTSVAWINKIVLDWCKDICPKVTPSFGTLTAYLRNKWHFDDILPMVRIAENKKLFDEDKKEIDSERWQEIFKKDLNFAQSKALSQEFQNYINNLEETDKPINDTDKQELFNQFRKDLRQFNKFYKRADHRHHAVDAAIIGLSTLSLIQQASSHNKRYGGLYEVRNDNGEVKIPGFEIKKDNARLYSAIKEKAQKYLTNYVVWHKPDRFPSGKFFDETAYNTQNVDGSKRFVIRQDLEKVLNKETDKNKFIEKLNSIIVGEELKNEVIKQLEDRLNAGMPLKEAFLEKDLLFRGNEIKKLKVFYKERGFNQFKENVDVRVNSKYYQNAGYAYMNFDKNSGNLIGAIPIWRYKSNNTQDSNVIRFFIGDMLFDKKAKEFYKVKRFAASAGRLICILASESDGKEIGFSNIKDLILIKTRQDLAKIKKEYGK